MTPLPDYAKLAADRAHLAQSLAQEVAARLASVAAETPGPMLSAVLVAVSDDCAVLSKVAAELALLHSLIDSPPADSPPPDDSLRCSLCRQPVERTAEGVLVHSGCNPAAIIAAATVPHLPDVTPPGERESIWSPGGPRWQEEA